jgi:hypothetical protein
MLPLPLPLPLTLTLSLGLGCSEAARSVTDPVTDPVTGDRVRWPWPCRDPALLADAAAVAEPDAVADAGPKHIGHGLGLGTCSGSDHHLP